MPSKSWKEKTEPLSTTFYDSPLGRYVLVTSDKGIVCLEPEEHAVSRITRWKEDGVSMKEGSSLANRAVRELEACENSLSLLTCAGRPSRRPFGKRSSEFLTVRLDPTATLPKQSANPPP